MTPLPDDRDFSWQNALRTIALIFIGVMLALGVQGWWRGHEEQQRVSQHLFGIKSDLHTTVENLDAAVKTDSLSLFGARRMQGFLTSDSVPLPPGDTIAVWLRIQYPKFEPVTASIDQMLQSGDVNLINDATLRRNLVEYASAVREARQHAEIRERLFHEYSATTRERSQANAHWKGAWNTKMPAHTVTYDVKALRDDIVLRVAYQNTVLQQAEHIAIVRNIRRRTQALLASLGETAAKNKDADPKKPKPQPQPNAPKPGTRKPAAPRSGSPAVIT